MYIIGHFKRLLINLKHIGYLGLDSGLSLIDSHLMKYTHALAIIGSFRVTKQFRG